MLTKVTVAFFDDRSVGGSTVTFYDVLAATQTASWETWKRHSEIVAFIDVLKKDPHCADLCSRLVLPGQWSTPPDRAKAYNVLLSSLVQK